MESAPSIIFLNVCLIVGRIALAIPVYELAMSVCLSVRPSVRPSVNILVKFLVQVKSQLWLQIHVCNLVCCLPVTSSLDFDANFFFFWFIYLFIFLIFDFWPWPWNWKSYVPLIILVIFVSVLCNPALPSSAVSCYHHNMKHHIFQSPWIFRIK